MVLPLETEVLIVGAGPVGATLANLLGQFGVRTLLIDRMAELAMQPRAITLDNEALRILQHAGLRATDLDCVAIDEVSLQSPIFGQFARMNTAGLQDGHPRLVTFYQPQLEQALLSALARHASVQVARSIEWLATGEQAQGCVVTLRRSDGTLHQLNARYVVGADGASSTLRRALGIDFRGSSYQEDWLIIDAHGAPQTRRRIEFRCDPRRPTPHIPGPAGRQRWEFMLHAHEDPAQMLKPETLAPLLAPWAELAQTKVERTAVYRFHARTASQFRLGRSLLVGDAAHVSPPFIGQGLVAGLRDVSNLAWKLAWVLRGQAGAHILDSYQRERQPHARAMIRLAQWMGQLVMPRHRLAAFFSHGLARLITLTPGLRSLIVDIKLKPRNRFRHGLFVRRGTGDRVEHGNQLPQGRWRNSAGEEELSDDVLGPYFQLIGIGVDPAACLGATRRDRWRALGGRFTTINDPASAATPPETGWADLEQILCGTAGRQGWLIAVRPDKVVLADAQPEHADTMIDEVMALLQ